MKNTEKDTFVIKALKHTTFGKRTQAIGSYNSSFYEQGRP